MSARARFSMKASVVSSMEIAPEGGWVRSERSTFMEVENLKSRH